MANGTNKRIPQIILLSKVVVGKKKPKWQKQNFTQQNYGNEIEPLVLAMQFKSKFRTSFLHKLER